MRNVNKSVFVFLIIVFFSCERKDEIHFAKTNDFINQTGTYYFNKNKIVIKEFKDGSLIFGVADNHNKVLYEHSIFRSFSGFSKWGLYIDIKQNIWFYTSDYQEYSVILKDSVENKYHYKKLDENSVEIPKEFKLKIK